MIARPIPKSYKTHHYCKNCEIWYKISIIGLIDRCPECNYKLRKKAHSSICKSEEAREKNRERQRLINDGISLY